jgi:hypothetical protein
MYVFIDDRGGPSRDIHTADKGQKRLSCAPSFQSHREKENPMKKATHDGICQVCSRRHRLPNGKLAKHGYQVEYGSFQGTCWGSEELPLEISCELVKKSIIWAKKEIESLTARAAKLRLPATEPKGFAHVNVTLGRFGSVWTYREVEIHVSEKGSAYYEWDARKHYHFTYSAPSDPLGFATKLNGSCADAIGRDIERTKRYVTQQEEVVAAWKPQPLLKRVA